MAGRPRGEPLSSCGTERPGRAPTGRSSPAFAAGTTGEHRVGSRSRARPSPLGFAARFVDADQCREEAGEWGGAPGRLQELGRPRRRLRGRDASWQRSRRLQSEGAGTRAAKPAAAPPARSGRRSASTPASSPRTDLDFVALTTCLGEPRLEACTIKFTADGIRLDNALAFWVHRVYQAQRNAMYRAFKEKQVELTPEQWGVLVRLWERDGRTTDHLCETTFRDRPDHQSSDRRRSRPRVWSSAARPRGTAGRDLVFLTASGARTQAAARPGRARSSSPRCSRTSRSATSRSRERRCSGSSTNLEA